MSYSLEGFKKPETKMKMINSKLSEDNGAYQLKGQGPLDYPHLETWSHMCVGEVMSGRGFYDMGALWAVILKPVGTIIMGMEVMLGKCRQSNR